MTDTLTTEQIEELEILAKSAEISWSNPEICGRFHIALNDAYPALIAMAKNSAEWRETAVTWLQRAEQAEIVSEDRAKTIATLRQIADEQQTEAARYRDIAVRLVKSLKLQQEAWAGNRTLAYLSELLKICEEPDIAALLSEPKP